MKTLNHLKKKLIKQEKKVVNCTKYTTKTKNLHAFGDYYWCKKTT